MLPLASFFNINNDYVVEKEAEVGKAAGFPVDDKSIFVNEGKQSKYK